VFIRKFRYDIIILLIYSSCIYPFDPPSKDYENLLVVDAFLSDGDDPFEVNLSRSIPIDTDHIIPEENAQVSISDNSGNLYDLYEEDPGRYLTSWDFHAQTGSMYQLHIQTTDGNQYESDTVYMRETPPIDSVFYRYEEKMLGESAEILPGLQIYLTTHDKNNNTWYYRWDFQETWEFRSRYNSEQIWEDDMVKGREEQVYLCWKYDRSTGVLVSTSKNLSEDIISEFPITYISNSTDRLESKYSILLKQYALSEASYNYWKEIEKVTENLGTLFDPQPSSILGNIYNINDEHDIVLGYFDAASVQEQRLFIKRGEFPQFAIRNYYEHCQDTIVGYGMIPIMITQGLMLVGEVPNDFGGVEYQLSTEPCIDCRVFGTNVVPDFWE
jgi:hypothetical protein